MRETQRSAWHLRAQAASSNRQAACQAERRHGRRRSHRRHHNLVQILFRAIDRDQKSAVLRLRNRPGHMPLIHPALLKRLDESAKMQDAVGFWWCCDALGRLRAKDAIPALAKYATATNPTGTYGPDGMAFGYVAAAALARLTADPTHPNVAPLLKGDNIWLKAGALRGLAEADAPVVRRRARPRAALHQGDAGVVDGEVEKPYLLRLCGKTSQTERGGVTEPFTLGNSAFARRRPET